MKNMVVFFNKLIEQMYVIGRYLLLICWNDSEGMKNVILTRWAAKR